MLREVVFAVVEKAWSKGSMAFEETIGERSSRVDAAESFISDVLKDFQISTGERGKRT